MDIFILAMQINFELRRATMRYDTLHNWVTEGWPTALCLVQKGFWCWPLFYERSSRKLKLWKHAKSISLLLQIVLWGLIFNTAHTAACSSVHGWRSVPPFPFPFARCITLSCFAEMPVRLYKLLTSSSLLSLALMY